MGRDINRRGVWDSTCKCRCACKQHVGSGWKKLAAYADFLC